MHRDVSIPNMMTGNHHLFSIVTVWLALKHAFCQAAFCQAGTHVYTELEETQAANMSFNFNAPFHLTKPKRVTIHGPFQKIR